MTKRLLTDAQIELLNTIGLGVSSASASIGVAAGLGASIVDSNLTNHGGWIDFITGSDLPGFGVLLVLTFAEDNDFTIVFTNASVNSISVNLAEQCYQLETSGSICSVLFGLVGLGLVSNTRYKLSYLVRSY